MKKLLPLLLLLVVFAAGCLPEGPISITTSKQLPVINSFGADRPSISPGESSTLSWTVTEATTVSIDQGIGSVALAGDRVVSPSATTIYTLTATNSAGGVTATAQVIVTGAVPPPASLPVVNSFTASPPEIIVGGSATLSWSVSNATSVTIDPGVGTFATSGSTIVSPAATTTYILTATNADGSTTATAQVIVSGMPSPLANLPAINYFTADPPIIPAGGSTTLSWSVSGATSVTIDPGVGPVDSVGTALVSPVASTNYTLTATNAFGWRSMMFPVVVTGGGPSVAYDFVEQAPTAYWWTKVGASMVELPFPGDLNDNRGFATYRYNIKLSDGNTYTRVLETHPQWIDNGWISGRYSGVYVPPGSKLRVKVGLISGASAGNVQFHIGKLGAVATISLNVSYADGVADGVKVMEANLDAYAGQTIDFVLGANALGTSAQDWAAWVAARIIY